MATKWLKVEIFPNIYRRFLISEKLIIGREQSCDVVMSEISVSAHHATIWMQGNEMRIKDEGSTNGTRVNEVLIQEHVLHDRDHIGIGNAHAYYTVELETKPKLRLDIGSSEIPNSREFFDCHDMVFVFPCQTENIQAVCKCLREKLANMPKTEIFVASLARFLEDLCEKKRANNTMTTLEGRFIQSESKLSFTIEEKLGDGTCKELLPKKEALPENGSLYQGIDVIEYGDNVIVLSTYLQNAPKEIEKKYLIHRYYSTMLVNSSFSIDIAFSEKKIASFPNFTTMPLRALSHNNDFVQVVPVFPGCLCVPPALEMNLNEIPARCRFWITPMVASKAIGYLQILRNGRVCQCIELPYLATTRKFADKLLAMALWLPALFILTSVFKFPLEEKMPVLSRKLLLLVDFLGGVLGLAILLGSLSLITAVILYLRSRPVKSSIVYDTVEM